jgi:hypothetical protein
VKDEQRRDTAEAAADTVMSGVTTAIERGPNDEWAVVVRRQVVGLAWALCRRVAGNWEVEDIGAISEDGDVQERSEWISTTDDDALPNVGVEIATGVAPEGATTVSFVGPEGVVTVPIDENVYCAVRWAVPDPAESDEDPEPVFRFSGG